MATRATETIAATGTVATYYAASAGGDKVTPDEGTLLHVKNANASSTIVTLTTPGTVSGLAIADRAVTVTNGTEQFIPLSTLYRNPTDGLADIAWSVSASVTFAVVRA